ncbi:MAG TPA: glucose 1-dehydrogenase [Pyrinomonadaceae bacterium]|nr:glucose 1-dehydrogenase [Pyrinomonadaceae bacterium]
MKAVAVFPEAKEIKIVEHEEPRLFAPTEVKLRVLEVGVCGTDKEICAFDYGAPPEGSPYLLLGHESLSEVVETGEGVERLKRGDLVVASVRRPCPHETCVACRMGRQDFCFTGDFTERGIKGRHGFMTEFVVDDERYMNVVPAHLREVGVLVEPLTIAEKALEQVWHMQKRLPWFSPPGEVDATTADDAIAAAAAPPPASAGVREWLYQRAVVLGAGPVGLLGAMALVVAGFDTYVYSREAATSDKARLVESFGGKYISAETHAVEQLAGQVGGIDLVYEAVGASGLAFEALKHLDTNGVFVFTGVPGRKAPVEVDTDALMRNLVLRNQLAFGTVNAGRGAFEAAIRDLEIFHRRWPQVVNSLITARVPIEGHRDLLLGKAGGIKNVVKLS